MKLGTALAILAAAAGAGAVTIYALKQKGVCIPQPCPSGYYWDMASCSCKQQCVPQVCNPGYVWDQNTCSCVPCTQTQPCPCNQVWDSVLCQCSNLIPSAILTQSYLSAYMPWWIYGSCLLGVTGYGTIDPSVLSCPSTPCQPGVGFPCNSSKSFTTQVTGQVVDSASHPICNQTVLIQYSQTSFPFLTSDGMWQGTFQVSGPSSVVTDSNGNFTINITVSMVNVSEATCNIFAGGSTRLNEILQLTLRVQNTIIETIVNLTLEMLICD